nr:MAG TPA: hypothetical protein [Caudoviricetes sp.]
MIIPFSFECVIFFLFLTYLHYLFLLFISSAFVDKIIAK